MVNATIEPKTSRKFDWWQCHTAHIRKRIKIAWGTKAKRP